jgi:hypothetical protein
MRRLFLVLDLSLLRQLSELQRQELLQQLTTAIGRLWAAYQHAGGGASGGAVRHISWGYALYDSACAELLLKPKLRRTAQTLSECYRERRCRAAMGRQGRQPSRRKAGTDGSRALWSEPK